MYLQEARLNGMVHGTKPFINKKWAFAGAISTWSRIRIPPRPSGINPHGFGDLRWLFPFSENLAVVVVAKNSKPDSATSLTR